MTSKSDATSVASSASLGSNADNDPTLGDDGELAEFRFLAADLDDCDISIDIPTKFPTLTSLNSEPLYGHPMTKPEAEAAVPEGDDGLIRHATVIPDEFCVRGKLISGLNKRDIDVERARIKPRRASLPITQSQLFSSLTKIDGTSGPRYIFNGVLNGWPSLRNFELIKLERKRALGPLTAPDYLDSMKHTWAHYWDVEKEGRDGISPAIKEKNKIYRAKLRGAPWSSVGWSPESPGFLLWFESQRPEGPRVTYGLQAVNDVGDDVCKTVHMISHRYATKKESARDKLTYHSIVLLEWDHGEYCTVVEGAYLNGIGGYKGQSNWYDDRDDATTSLYEALPPQLVSPWLTTATEIRCFDVPVKNLDGMKEYIDKYTGQGKRFVDPHYTFSHAARLTYRSRSDIAQYLLNYVSRDSSYSELTRNCQTLSADLCSFLAGKKGIAPYHPLNRIDYHNRSHFFLYDSTMYTARRKAHLKGKLAV